ncbi:MAG: GAF domain-containing protein [Gammaproteobacteria bacterium]|nr:GAF domain-containing protein [Gammaproteobacteria bacterium]
MIAESLTPPEIFTETGSDESDVVVIEQAARLIAHSTEPEFAIQSILRLLSQLLGLNRGRVLIPEEKSGVLRIRYSYGLTREERERGIYELGEGVSGRVMKTGQTALIQNIDDEPSYLGRAVSRTTLPSETVAYIALPLLRNDKPIGVLAVHRLRKRQRAFDKDITTLRIIATFISQILTVNRLIAEQTAELINENLYLKNALDHQGGNFGILGDSPALQASLRQAYRVANTQVSVLLTGESGTGKEKFARMLHLASNRKDAPFVAINCAAIPQDLIESELFGHEKGSFTGATQSKKGKIELASGGTLFLDEIGDLDFDLQAKLLRMLQEQVIQRVGGTREIGVDVRIIAATHRNLQQAVNEGRFRMDLFYRLNVFPIHLPPLRDRVEDVRILARHFLNIANHDYNRNVLLDETILQKLERFDWPGNIRQLENVIKRAVLIAHTNHVSPSEIDIILGEESRVAMPQAGMTHAPAMTPAAPMAPAYSQHDSSIRPYAWVRDDESEQIIQALRQARGNKTRAAINLGLTPRQLRYRMVKLGIDA